MLLQRISLKGTLKKKEIFDIPKQRILIIAENDRTIVHRFYFILLSNICSKQEQIIITEWRTE